MTRLLIVNADDYGLTEAISRGILRAHRDGVVTSTSVMAVGPSIGRTAGWLGNHPGLATGAHLTLVGEDPPLLTRREIPSLVTRSGRFANTWTAFLARAALGRVDPEDVRRELDAQIQALTRDHGLRLTHLDSHQHLHLWPPIATVLVALARHWRVPAVRVPTSHAWNPKGYGIRRLSRLLAARVRRAGLASPEAYDGLDGAGRLERLLFVDTVHRMSTLPAVTVEVNCHPGEADVLTANRYAWDYRWSDELAALTSPQVRAAILRGGFRLGTYADLERPSIGGRVRGVA